MSEAEEAYRAAQREIARVAAEGQTVLRLNAEDFLALDRIPPELAALTALQTLDLEGTQVSDLAPLAALTALQRLDFNNTRVSDLAPLVPLTALQWLDLNGTQVSDLAPLTALTTLQGLTLSDTQVSDLAPLAALTALKWLDLDGTQVSDLAPLAALTALQSLYLSSTRVSDLAPLAALKALQNLHLIRTQVSDLTPLAALTGLQSLHLGDTQVSDLAPLAALTALQSLNLENTQVSDLAPLAALTALEWLFLDGTKVSDLVPLAALTALQGLYLDGTQVRNIAPLAALSALQGLYLDGTQVSELAPLTALSNLQSLGLTGTLVSDLRPIATLVNLGEGEIESGLRYKLTPATKRDLRLAGLAQIGDSKDRGRETLAYLRSLPPWPEPYIPTATPDASPPILTGETPKPPEQDPALALIWGKNGFSFFARSIDSDPVTEAALSDLRALLDDLRRKGNRHDDLYRIAGELQERSTGAVPDLNMIKLHLSYQKLRRLYAGRAARENEFDDETVTTMEAVFDVLPGVTLADDGVRILIERQETERAVGLSEAQNLAAGKVLEDVRDDDAPFALEVKDIAVEILRPGAEDRLAATRGILSRNVVVGVLTFVGVAVAQGAVSGPVGNFVYEHGANLLAYAVTMGGDALFWAQSVLSKFRVEYELAMGITREISGSLPAKLKFPRRGGGLGG